MAKSFRTHFKQSPATESMKSSHTNSTAVDQTSVVSTDSENKNKNYADKSYIKSNYEFKPFCNSRFASSTENMLTRLQNSLAMGFNHFKDGRLPQYIVVVLDDDLITYLDFKKEGATTLLGIWIQWLAQEAQKLLQDRLQQLPVKCKKTEVFFYWVSAPLHSFFSKERNDLRTRFNLALDSVIKTQKNMRIIKLKDWWNSKDSSLVIHDRITETGMGAYWKAVDASFHFNDDQRQTFLAKTKYSVALDKNRTLQDQEIVHFLCLGVVWIR